MKTNSLARTTGLFIHRCNQVHLSDYMFAPWEDMSFLLEVLPHLSLNSKYKLYGCLPRTIWTDDDVCRLCINKVDDYEPSNPERSVYRDLEGGLPYKLFISGNVVPGDYKEEWIWEMFLLLQAWHFLPMWGEGFYNRRTVITDADALLKTAGVELNDGRPGSKDAFLNLNELIGDESLLPSVHIISDTTAAITYTYWTHWGGLIRATVDATLQDGNMTLGEEKQVTLVKYNCNIHF